MTDTTEEKKYERDQVVTIINSVLENVRAPQPDRQAVFEQIKSLKNILESLREDISATSIKDVPTQFVPNATDELDAVVMSTEEATETIMSCCEVLEGLAEKEGDEVSEVIEAQVTKIYEACCFQDLTGQRISKVTKALKEIEEQTNTILLALEKSFEFEKAFSSLDDEECDDKKGRHLSGPALPDQKVSQDEIDKLLAAF